jgi:hypothetical protein
MRQGTDAFGTPEELAFAKREGKTLYVVKIADRMVDAKVGGSGRGGVRSAGGR